MNYQALIYFKTLAELKHYTRAAAKLYISQPALTKSIHNLELELGAPLFQRDGRNIALTKYGTLFYPYAKQAIESIDDGIEAFSHLLNTETNVIFMSCLYSMWHEYHNSFILQRSRTKNVVSKFPCIACLYSPHPYKSTKKNYTNCTYTNYKFQKLPPQ